MESEAVWWELPNERELRQRGKSIQASIRTILGNSLQLRAKIALAYSSISPWQISLVIALSSVH
jgi:hypothetical protein